MFRRGFVGDCSTASVLGEWALERIGMPASIYMLWSPAHEWAHGVAVSDDGTVLISNRDVALIDRPDEWWNEILDGWGGSYTMITKVRE